MTLEEARICFMLVASIDMFQVEDIYKIYRSNEIKITIKWILEIMKSH